MFNIDLIGLFNLVKSLFFLFFNLRFKGFDNVWVKEKLGNLVEIKSGKSPKNLLDPNGEFPYFKVEQLNNCNKYLNGAVH